MTDNPDETLPVEQCDRDAAWLIERRCSPPQWSIVCDPSGIGAFYEDVHRAHRFATRADAEYAMRRMCITSQERGQFFVTEHVWISLPVGQTFDEDFLADVIDDSMDMDWTGRVGAQAILRAMAKCGIEIRRAAQSPPPVVSEEMLTDAVAWAINVEFTRLNASKIWQPLRQEEAEALAKAALRALSSPSRGCDAETVEACAKVAEEHAETKFGPDEPESIEEWRRGFVAASETIAAAIRNLGKETRQGEGE